MEIQAKYLRWPFLGNLESCFHVLNKEMFHNLLMPVHVVLPDKKVIFRFDAESYSLMIGQKFSEINIENVLPCYLHELVHLWNYANQIEDCSVNHYHNKKFLDSALKFGFFVGRNSSGWGSTTFSPTDSCQNPTSEDLANLQRCLSQVSIDTSLFEEMKEEMGRIASSASPSKTFLKYVCQCNPPFNSIRSGRKPDGENPLKIKCEICNSYFQLADS